MKKSIMLLACLIIMGLQATIAQTRTIGGNVTSSDDGMKLAGVSVSLKGTSSGTITDVDGNYSIGVSSENTILVFSFVGMATQEILIENATEINVSMVPTDINLDEVVVTALGISREKKALGYSVQDVSGSELAETRDVNVVNSLSGRVAGVSITGAQGNTGGSSRILIRGASSVNGNNQPLFVVDGVPFDNSGFNNRNTARGAGGYDYGNMAQDIDPNDVESISVLKGPGAAALYGSRASNGVILITTRKGSPRKGIGISLNSGITFEQVAVLPKYQNLYGGGNYNVLGGSEWYTNEIIDGTEYHVVDFAVDESWGPRYDGQMVLHWDSFDEWDTENYMVPREWKATDADVEDFFDLGVSYTNNLSMEGGNEKARFRMSYTNLNLDGYMPNSSLKRNTFSFNGSAKLGKKVEAFANMSYVSNASVGRPATGYANDNIMVKFNQWGQRQLDMDRLNKYKNPDGTMRTWNRSSWDDPTAVYADNPYWIRYENYEEDQRDRYFGNFGFRWNIADWLDFQAKINQDQYQFAIMERIAVGSQAPSRYEEIHRSNFERNSEFLFLINKELSPSLVLNGSFGANMMYNKYTRNSAVTKGGMNIPNFYTITNSIAPPAIDQYMSEKAINSLMGSASLGYKSLLYLDLTARNDWSSTLPKENNSYLYYSLAASFVFSELAPLKQMNWFTFGKLRAGWARVGNDTDPYRLDPYYTQPLDNTDYYPYHFWGQNALYSVPMTINNPGLLPETTTSLELGADLKFFNNRLGIDFTYYDMSTKDQIIDLRVSAGTGYTYKLLNAGEITNKGVELMLTATPIQAKNTFQWDVIVNFARNINEVVSLAPGIENYQLSNGPFQVSVNATVGEKYGALMGTDYVYDKDGNKVVGPDGLYLTSGVGVIGNAMPDWTAGITNTFSFKGFDISGLIDIRMGGEYYSTTHLWGTYTGIFEETATPTETGNTIREDGMVVDGMAAAVDADGNVLYNEDGTAQVSGKNDVNVPAISWAWHHYNGPYAQNVFDASYIKLRDLRIGYTLPAQWSGPFESIRISAFGKNLAIWGADPENPHVDPENTTSSGNIQGIEGGALPSLRQFGLNLNVKF
jgi:TonB-linked SusC/RagA family outer membrane protein